MDKTSGSSTACIVKVANAAVVVVFVVDAVVILVPYRIAVADSIVIIVTIIIVEIFPIRSPCNYDIMRYVFHSIISVSENLAKIFLKIQRKKFEAPTS